VTQHKRPVGDCPSPPPFLLDGLLWRLGGGGRGGEERGGGDGGVCKLVGWGGGWEEEEGAEENGVGEMVELVLLVRSVGAEELKSL